MESLSNYDETDFANAFIDDILNIKDYFNF